MEARTDVEPTGKLLGTVTPAQADILRAQKPGAELTPEAGEIRAGLGATASRDEAALVVHKGEDGTESPAEIVSLDPRDPGTVLEPHTLQELGLPSPEAAHAELQAAAQAPQTPEVK